MYTERDPRWETKLDRMFSIWMICLESEGDLEKLGMRDWKKNRNEVSVIVIARDAKY